MDVYQSFAELEQNAQWQNILVFNDDYLIIGEDYDYDGAMGFTLRHYESIFVRVK